MTGDLSIELCGVRLRGPVLNGSGTFDAIAALRVFGDALLEEFPFDAFVSKTITLAPRQGNPPPRLWETPAGMINSIGLPNKGLEGFLREDLPKLAELPVPLCVSVMGFSRDELAGLVKQVAVREEVALIELNFSCPNVETGLIMGADPDETARTVGVWSASPLLSPARSPTRRHSDTASSTCSFGSRSRFDRTTITGNGSNPAP